MGLPSSSFRFVNKKTVSQKKIKSFINKTILFTKGQILTENSLIPLLNNVNESVSESIESHFQKEKVAYVRNEETLNEKNNGEAAIDESIPLILNGFLSEA